MKAHSLSKRFRAVLGFAAIVLYSTGCGGSPATEMAATETAPIPLESPEASPTAPVPTEPTIPTSTPSISTTILLSLPTSTWKEGWVDFINGYYGYAISLPASAVVTKREIISMPGEAQYLTFDQLKLMYPPGACVGIDYGSVDVTIRVANSLGGANADPCGRTGIGAVHPVWTEEQVNVGGVSYPATHGEMYESDAPGAKLLEDFHYVYMEDEAVVYFGDKMDGWQDQAAYEQYLKDKEIVFEILRSYRSVPRTELYCPAPASTRLKVGDSAYVNNVAPLMHNTLRGDPGVNQSLIGSIAPGEAMEVLEGPVCNNSLQWFKVRVSETGLEGWTPEGSHEAYWLIPCESKEKCGGP